MKRLYALFLVCFFAGTAVNVGAQAFGNEWIVFSQRYLKIKVAQDGVYRLDSATLANAMMSVGTSLSSIYPQNIQLFHNGQEEYIWIEGESDSVFNAGDYLEFYGTKNDGAPDSSLYGGSAFSGSGKSLMMRWIGSKISPAGDWSVDSPPGPISDSSRGDRKLRSASVGSALVPRSSRHWR